MRISKKISRARISTTKLPTPWELAQATDEHRELAALKSKRWRSMTKAQKMKRPNYRKAIEERERLGLEAPTRLPVKARFIRRANTRSKHKISLPKIGGK